MIVHITVSRNPKQPYLTSGIGIVALVVASKDPDYWTTLGNIADNLAWTIPAEWRDGMRAKLRADTEKIVRPNPTRVTG